MRLSDRGTASFFDPGALKRAVFATLQCRHENRQERSRRRKNNAARAAEGFRCSFSVRCLRTVCIYDVYTRRAAAVTGCAARYGFIRFARLLYSAAECQSACKRKGGEGGVHQLQKHQKGPAFRRAILNACQYPRPCAMPAMYSHSAEAEGER